VVAVSLKKKNNLTFAYFMDPQGHLIALSKGVVQ